MWFRLALILILWLLLYRLFSRLLRSGSKPRREDLKTAPGNRPNQENRGTAWSPSDVIDVRYWEVETPPSDEEAQEPQRKRGQSV